MKFLPIRGTQDEFVKRSTKCYRAVKHADNEVPDALTLLNSYYENCLVLRHWVAGRLGVSKRVLADRLEQDPMSHERVPVED